MENQMENNNNQGNDGRGFRHSGQTFMVLIIAAVVTFFVYTMIRGVFVSGVTQEISYTEFMNMVDSDQVQQVEWGDSDITRPMYAIMSCRSMQTPSIWWIRCSSMVSLFIRRNRIIPVLLWKRSSALCFHSS